jgi:hypothetical protein
MRQCEQLAACACSKRTTNPDARSSVFSLNTCVVSQIMNNGYPPTTTASAPESEFHSARHSGALHSSAPPQLNYPPPQGHGGYPPPQGGYAPGYGPPHANYPPQGGYQPQAGYAPAGPGYAPAGPGYPGGYAPPHGGYAPPQPMAMQPQIIMVNAPAAAQQPIVINNNNNNSAAASSGGKTVVVVQKPAVNHCCHAVLCWASGGIWLPCWICACLGLCCQRPCGF